MPGSLLTYTLDKSMKTGVRAGILLSIGHAILEFFLVILLFLGLGKYLSSPLGTFIISLAGGLLLLFFAFTSLNDLRKGNIKLESDSQEKESNSNLLLGGALVSAANPYFIVWWAIIGLSLLTSAYAAFGFLGIALFYFGHIFSDLSWYIFVSILVSKSKKFINLKVYKIIILLLSLALIYFGASFLVSAFTNLPF